MKNIYCISGLGADHRLFMNISVPGYNLVPVPWVPLDAQDEMSGYAMKMAKTIPEKGPIILGLSLGGMLAIEIAKAMPVGKVIIVSSAKTRAELGYDNMFFRLFGRAGILPEAIINRTSSLQLYFLGAQSEDDRQLLKAVIRDADPVFVKRAVDMLLRWENASIPDRITHIHGTGDRTIRPSNVHPDHWVEGGSHIMIYNRADEINKLLAGCLAESAH